MKLRTIAGWVFRLYVLALVVGVIVLIVWFVGDLPGLSERVATVWYAIAGIGGIALVLLVAVRLLTS